MNVYKTINGVVTHLIVWGDVFGSSDEEIILCIIGCPGISLFYKEFGAELHRRTQTPLCIIGHAGHHTISKERKQKLRRIKKSYNIKGQMEHKLQFIRKHIKPTKKLHIIGHSLGAWLLVEMLDKDENLLQQVGSVHLLFPTLQNFAAAPVGRCLNVIKKIHFLAILFLFILDLIPKAMKQFLIQVYLKINSLPYNYTERILLYIKPEIADKALKLAYEFIDVCTKLTNIDKIKHLTHVIYAIKDNMVPLRHIEDLKVYQPQLQMKELDVDHAFVLKSSNVVAESVSEFINKKLSLKNK